MTLEETAQREPAAGEDAMRKHRLGGIRRTGRMKTAAAARTKYRGQHRGKRVLVEPDQSDEEAPGERNGRPDEAPSEAGNWSGFTHAALR
jgi:hypothetical protein